MRKFAVRIGRLAGRLAKRLGLGQRPVFYGNICIRCGHHVVKHLLNEGRCIGK